MAPKLELSRFRGAAASLVVATALSCAPGMTAQSAPPRALVAASVEAAVADALAGRSDLGTVEVHAAATGSLARQVELGLAADVFVSADSVWMQHLVESGHASGSPVEIAGNRLAWVHRQPGRSLEAVAADLVGCFAMPDPAAAPLGRYTRQALTGLEVWPLFEARAAGSANARANAALLRRQDCPIGVVYASDTGAFAEAVVIPIDPRLHDPIRYEVVGLARGRPEVAERMIAALRDDAARAAFARHGFAEGAS